MGSYAVLSGDSFSPVEAADATLWEPFFDTLYAEDSFSEDVISWHFGSLRYGSWPRLVQCHLILFEISGHPFSFSYPYVVVLIRVAMADFPRPSSYMVTILPEFFGVHFFSDSSSLT